MSRGNRCDVAVRRHPHLRTPISDTLDLAAIPTLKDLSHLPVIVDPSHATGKWVGGANVEGGDRGRADGLLISAFQPRMPCVTGEVDSAIEIQGVDGRLAEDCGRSRSYIVTLPHDPDERRGVRGRQSCHEDTTF